MKKSTDKNYIERFLCKTSEVNEFDEYGLTRRDNFSFLSESDFCDKIEKAVIVSESGMGKTRLLKNLNETYLREKSKIFMLSQYKSTPPELRKYILRFIKKFKSQQNNSEIKPFILLDALDEAEDISEEITRYLKNDIKLDQIKLVITSRYRESIGELIKNIDIKDDDIYKLTPPSLEDVKCYVKKSGINPQDFLIAITSKSVASMCSNPIGLNFLLQSFQKDDFSSKNVADIWKDGIERLCDKTDSKKKSTSNFSIQEKMDCACWIAITMALNNKSCVYTGIKNDTGKDSVYIDDLVHDNFTKELLKETIENTALFFHDAANYQSSFSHTTYFEHCAAIGIKKFINKLNRRLLLREDGKGFYRKFYGIASRLALIDPEYREEILELQPNLLLQFKDNVNSFDSEILCEKIIEYYAKEPDKYMTIRFEEYSRFKNLENKDNKICKYLTDIILSEKAMNSSKLELIIDIARDSACHDFADTLADIAIGKIIPAKDNYNVKISALNAMTCLENDAAKKRLYKEFDLSKEDDSRDELKGYYLINLWPKILPTNEMTKLLTIPKMLNFSGGYSYFLSYYLPKKFKEIDFDINSIAELLNWSVEFLYCKEDWYPHVEAAMVIYSYCWQFASINNVIDILADVYLSAFRKNHCPFNRYKSWRPESYYLSPEEFRQDRDSRFKVLLSCFNKSKGEQMSSLASCFPNYSLLNIDDAKDIFYKLINEKDEHIREFWENCIETLIPEMDFNVYKEEMNKLSLIDSEFIENMKNIKAQCENNVIESTNHQKQFEENEDLREKQQVSKSLKYEEEIREVLNNPSSNWESFSAIIYNIKMLEQKPGKIGFELDVSKCEFWGKSKKIEKEKLLTMARDYLFNTDRFQDRKKNTVFVEPLQALCLLQSKANEVFENLSINVWGKFADEIVRFAYEQELKPVLKKLTSFEGIFENSVLRFIKERGESISMYNIGVFLSSKTVEKIMNEFHDWDEYVFHELLCNIIKYTKHEKVVKRFVEMNYADIENNKRYSYLFLMLALSAEKRSEVIPKIQKYNNECKECFGMLIHQDLYQEKYLLLPVSLLAQFYIWLNRNYPKDKEPYHEGVYSPTGIDEIYSLKWKIIGKLQYPTSPESLAAIEEIRKAFPNENYSYYYYKSYESIQEAKFQPIEIEMIKKLYNAKDSSTGFLIQTKKDLLEAVIITLSKYQEYLQNERFYNVKYLWNYSIKSKKITDCCPKYEKDFSDHMAQFLKDKLEKEFFIVANREVIITADSIPDLLIQLANKETTLELMIEVKCNWHEKFEKAIFKQLLKYVNNSNSKIGLAVAAWFESEKWTNDNNRAKKNKCLRKKGIEHVRNLLEEHAKELSNSGFDIRVFVVDCLLKCNLVYYTLQKTDKSLHYN